MNPEIIGLSKFVCVHVYILSVIKRKILHSNFTTIYWNHSALGIML